eukprot:scaffold123595_cov75-Phaeocystis_antarctica.AAC.1
MFRATSPLVKTCGSPLPAQRVSATSRRLYHGFVHERVRHRRGPRGRSARHRHGEQVPQGQVYRGRRRRAHDRRVEL